MKTVKAKVKYCQLQGSGELSCRNSRTFCINRADMATGIYDTLAHHLHLVGG